MITFSKQNISVIVTVTFLSILLTCLCSPSLAETSNNKDLAETLWDDGLKYFRIYDYETAIQKFNTTTEAWAE